MGDQKKAYTPKDFQESWQIGKSTFWKFLKENPDFPIIRLGRRVLIPVEDADNFMRRLMEKQKSA